MGGLKFLQNLLPQVASVDQKKVFKAQDNSYEKDTATVAQAAFGKALNMRGLRQNITRMNIRGVNANDVAGKTLLGQ